MGKHTPGEWVAIIEKYGFLIEARTFLETGEIRTRTEIARREANIDYYPRDMYGDPSKPPCADTNAYLIAAAPDMLEALKMILANDGSSAVFSAVRLYEAQELARKAIKKATGSEG